MALPSPSGLDEDAGSSAQPGSSVAVTLLATRRLMWLLGLPVLLLLGVLTGLEHRQRAADAERAIDRVVDERAQELAELARPATEHVNDLRALLQAQWKQVPDPGPELAAALAPRRVDGHADGWTLDDATPEMRERYGQVWWAEPDGSAPPVDWVRRAALFNAQARVVQERALSFEATWFAGTELNVSFGYPHVSAARITDSLGLPSLTAIAALRARATAAARERLADRPFERSHWGAPYVSQLSSQLVVSHSADVFVDGQHVGQVSVDMLLDELQRRMQAWRGDEVRQWIVDEHGLVLADSAQPLPPPARAGLGNTPVVRSLADSLPAGLRGVALAPLEPLAEGGQRLEHPPGWLLAYARRKDSPWTYVQATPQAVLRQAILPKLLPNALIAVALLGMFVAGQWLMSRAFVDPAMRVLAYLRGLSLDALQPAPQLGARWQPWLDAVTDTFRTQRELQHRERQREAFKSAIVDNALAAIVATDAEGRIVEFNPAAEAMFGHAHDAVLGRALGDVIVPPRYRAGHAAGMKRVRDGGAARIMGRRVEMAALRADGSEFPVEMVLWRTEVDGEMHFTASLTDLSERQRSAEQIERQREALRQSEKLTAMGGLLAGVAHELNNPLAIVMGRASLLEEKCERTPELKADAQRIREAAERCGRIVRTFLNMARQRPPQRHGVQLNDLVRAGAEMLAYTLRSHGIALDLELAADLPEVTVDGDQIGQVVLNLLVNAQQALAGDDAGAAARGPRRVRLATGLEAARATAAPRQQRIWLRVVDNGPGVPVALRDKIFEPFFTTKPEGMGTGLGLAVSRSLVREHGGDLTLENTFEGSSFRMSLPISGLADTAVASPSPADDDEATLGRLLVVDDEPEIAELMRAMLEGAGWEVATAESGAVALELLDEARFDAIVCDLRMPTMDGAALWREVGQRHPALAQRMLFVTGDTLSPGARQFLDESRCASLDKPFTRDDLLERVRHLLAH